MNVPTKLGAYLVGVLAVFGTAAGIGAAVGPVGGTASAHDATHTESTTAPPTTTADFHTHPSE